MLPKRHLGDNPLACKRCQALWESYHERKTLGTQFFSGLQPVFLWRYTKRSTAGQANSLQQLLWMNKVLHELGGRNPMNICWDKLPANWCRILSILCSFFRDACRGPPNPSSEQPHPSAGGLATCRGLISALVGRVLSETGQFGAPRILAKSAQGRWKFSWPRR